MTMKLKISRAILLEKMEAYRDSLEAERQRTNAQGLTEAQEWILAAREATLNLLEALDGINPDTMTREQFEALPVESEYWDVRRSDITLHLGVGVPTFITNVDFRLERDYEAIKAVDPSYKYLTIGPDDHLYRYLAQPGVRR